MTEPIDLAQTFGSIDIYLFDQILKGRITRDMRVLDAGCGTGRNLVYFLRRGQDVSGIDRDPDAVNAVRELAAELAPTLSPDHFRSERIEEASFSADSMDVVISNAVLHFARDDGEFDAVLNGSWRLLKPGGLFFCRLASTIGMSAERFHPVAGRRFVLPDGSTRYLVDETLLLARTKELGGELIEPIKTTVVQDQRCMTTWVVRKR